MRLRTLARVVPLVLGGMAGAGAALLYRRYQNETRAMRVRLASESQLAQTARGPVEYAFVGPMDGPLVLMSHGGGGGYDQGIAAAPLLPECRVLAVSRFGYLRSPAPADASPMTQADAYAALLDTLGIEKVFVLGVSAGGPAGLQFALRHPERCQGLILGSALIEPVGELAQDSTVLNQIMLHLDFVFWLIIRFFPEPILTLTGSTPALRARMTPAERRWLFGLLDTLLPMAIRQVGLALDFTMAFARTTYALESMRVPTMVFHAQDDPLAPFAWAEAAARRIPGAELIAVPEGGHFAIAAGPEYFAPIHEFIRTHA